MCQSYYIGPLHFPSDASKQAAAVVKGASVMSPPWCTRARVTRSWHAVRSLSLYSANSSQCCKIIFLCIHLKYYI